MAPLLEWESDDVLTAVFARVPLLSQGALRATCRRARDVLRSAGFRRARVALGCAEAALVVAGGVARRRATAACWRVVGGRCDAIAPMATARAFACAGVVGGELVVAGGSAGGDALASAEAYDPSIDAWRPLRPMREGRQGAACGVVAGSLVVAGGGDLRSGPLASVEAWRDGTWRPLPPMPFPAWSAAAAVVGGVLYVAGGVTSAKLQAWDGASWTVLRDLPEPRNGAAAAELDGALLVMGGRTRGTRAAWSSTLRYDPRTDAWSAAPPLPRAGPRGSAAPPPRVHAWCAAASHAGAVVLCGDQSTLYLRGGAWEAPRDPHPPDVARACLGSLMLG